MVLLDSVLHVVGHGKVWNLHALSLWISPLLILTLQYLSSFPFLISCVPKSSHLPPLCHGFHLCFFLCSYCGCHLIFQVFIPHHIHVQLQFINHGLCYNIGAFFLLYDHGCSSQKSGNGSAATKASFLGGRKLRQGKVTNRASVRSFSVSAEAVERPIWFPGSVPPPWLDGRLSLHWH